MSVMLAALQPLKPEALAKLLAGVPAVTDFSAQLDCPEVGVDHTSLQASLKCKCGKSCLISLYALASQVVCHTARSTVQPCDCNKACQWACIVRAMQVMYTACLCGQCRPGPLQYWTQRL